jgi:O-antigen ligase
VLGAVAVILFVAPLPYGSVGTGARTGIGIAVLALFIVSSAREALGARRMSDPAVDLISTCLAIVAVYGLVQTVPLPSGVLARVSPGAHALYLAVVPGYSDSAGVDEAWGAISIAPLETWLAVAQLFACTALFLVVAREARTDRRIAFLAGAIVLAGLFEGVYGIFRHATHDTTIFGALKAHDQRGVTGSFFNRNHFAGYLGMIALLAMGILVGARPEQKRGLLASLNTPRALRSAGLALALVVLATALSLSLSRSAIASVGGACLALALLLGLKRGWRLALALAVIISIGGAFAASQSLDRIVMKFQQTASSFQRGREGIWAGTARMFADHPTAGVGLGAYGAAFERYKPVFEGRPQLRVEHAHNDYLEALAELGVVGALPLAIAALAVAIVLCRRWMRLRDPLRERVVFGCLGALIYIGLHSLTDFNLHVPANALTVAAIAGLGLAASRPEGGRLETAGARARDLFPHFALALAALAVIAFDHRVWRADALWPLHPGIARTKELAAVETDIALGRLRAARGLLPAHAGYRVTIGRRLVRQAESAGTSPLARASLLGEARASFAEALARNPGYIPALTHLAGAEFALGRVNDAVSHHRAAMSLSPKDYYAPLRYALDVVTYLPAIPPGMRALYLISAEEEMLRGIGLSRGIEKNPTVLRRLIDIYLLGGKPERAMPLLMKLRIGDLADLPYTLARAEILASRPETVREGLDIYRYLLGQPLDRARIERVADSIERIGQGREDDREFQAVRARARSALGLSGKASGPSAR